MPSPCNKLYAFSESYTKEHAIDIADVQIKTYIFNPEMEGVQKFLYIKQSGYPGPDDGERHSHIAWKGVWYLKFVPFTFPFAVNVTCQADYDDDDSFINNLFGFDDGDGE